MAKGAFERLKEKWEMWNPLFSWHPLFSRQLLGLCDKILKIKLGDGFPANLLAALSARCFQRCFCTRCGLFLPSHVFLIPQGRAVCPDLTEQHSHQLLHLLVPHFLPVVTELLRKGKSGTSYSQMQWDNNNTRTFLLS